VGIGIRIKTILHDKKMTIKQLSELSGVSLNTLYSITKRDSDNIDPVILRKISSALGVDHDELSGRLVVSFSDTMFENDDGEFFTFGTGTYLGKIASISHGLRKDGQDVWLKIGDTMIDLDDEDRQRLADHATLLANQPKYPKDKEKPLQD